MSHTPPGAESPTLSPAPARAARRPWLAPVAVAVVTVCGLGLLAAGRDAASAPPGPPAAIPGRSEIPAAQPVGFRPQPDVKKKVPAPDIDGGVAWLNTAGPLTLKDLKGKIVLLDFWTLCCINCIHNLPDLAKLGKKYANELVIIGVHSPKFDSEKETANIRKAILRYQIDHPVVNDANHKIWDRYEVDAWPTLVLIDPEGNLVGYTSGEGNYELLDIVIGKVADDHRKKKTLNEKPIRFDLAKFREKGDTPLFFPGKVLADAKGKRLFIADSTHHRLVITDLDGKLLHIIGTGEPGLTDGGYLDARFHDPQGMALDGDTLYVADRKNHTIREIDLKARSVTTIAGTGTQENEPDNRRLVRPVPAKKIGLNSPWDLYLQAGVLYIAMAGHHQIWALDLRAQVMMPFAGTGAETLRDGPRDRAMFAQPSGLASDGRSLFVADSETSSLRLVGLAPDGRVTTLVGRGLFVFGDRDGYGQDGGITSTTEARMQHALGVAYHNNKVYIADTYNNKVKEYDLRTRKLTTLIDGRPFGDIGPALLDEPAGISYADGKLYVADTNAHRIRVIDLKTKAVTTLKLTGVEPPPPPKADEDSIGHGFWRTGRAMIE